MDTESLRLYLPETRHLRRAHIALVLVVTLVLLVLGTAILIGAGVNLPAEQQLIGPFRWLPMRAIG